jgi:hypothetical protein
MAVSEMTMSKMTVSEMAVSEVAVSEMAVPEMGVRGCRVAINERSLAMLGNCMLIARHKVYLLKGCGYGSDPGMSKSFFRTREREDVW